MKSIIYFFTLLFCSILISQQPPEVHWAKTYGGSKSDKAWSIQSTLDGGYILAGVTESDDGDISNHIGLADFWIIKLNDHGNKEWEKTFGGSKNDIAYHIEQVNDGGYIIVGASYSDDGHVGDHHGSTNNTDVWVVKIDESGNMQWEKNYGGNSSDLGYCIKQTTDGGYIVAGYTSSNSGDVSGNNGAGTGDFWVFKITNLGVLEWQKCYGGSEYERAFSIAVTNDGGFIVTGQSYTWDGSGDVSNHYGGADYWVVKADSIRNIEWERSYGGLASDIPYTILQTSDGGYIVAGKSLSYDGDISHNLGSGDYWVLKLDANGIIQWERNYGGTGNEGGDFILSIRIIEKPGQGYLLVGSTDSVQYKMDINEDIWVFRLDYSGNILWHKAMGGTNTDRVSAVCLTNDGSFVLTGLTYSSDGDFDQNKGNSDFWIIKLFPEQMSTSDSNYAQISIHPNPAQNQLNFSEPLTHIQIYNALGQQVKTLEKGTHINISKLPKGTYFLKAKTQSGKVVERKFVKN